MRGKISSGVKGASNTLSQDSQLEHTLSDGDFPKTVSDYADITDELHLDSSMFSFHDIVDGEKLIATEKGQIMDGKPIIIESEYIVPRVYNKERKRVSNALYGLCNMCSESRARNSNTDQ